jgi:hypothetical protein
MAQMNRGVIGANGSSTGHVHRLPDLTDVEIDGTPEEGAVLMYVNGRWTAVKPA